MMCISFLKRKQIYEEEKGIVGVEKRDVEIQSCLTLDKIFIGIQSELLIKNKYEKILIHINK